MYDSKQVHSEDSDSCPFIPVNQRALNFGQENMFCLPVETQQAQLLNPSSQAKGNDQILAANLMYDPKQVHSEDSDSGPFIPMNQRDFGQENMFCLPVETQQAQRLNPSSQAKG
ncbi:hypothetical protein KP509_29G018900 [Ceratopteris richardii]|uniref:Uncharacterized protein n=1 Tax=Ceratopteris richardii TaxID=49495 RepID=A0A8T2R7H9_CERRI|nr:hypothetical protein KP509_29G018900 [Ceratopteris richardii]